MYAYKIRRRKNPVVVPPTLQTPPTPPQTLQTPPQTLQTPINPILLIQTPTPTPTPVPTPQIKIENKKPIQPPTATPTATPTTPSLTFNKETIRQQSYIGKQGYTIPKSVFSPDELKALKRKLTMIREETQPTNNKRKMFQAQQQPQGFPIYLENEKKIYIPRFFGMNEFGIPDRNEIPCGNNINVSFQKELRDYQEVIVQSFMSHIERGVGVGTEQEHAQEHSAPNVVGGGAILEVPCGKGKTVMALRIVSLVAKKTLILVHKDFLANQWEERIREYLPLARVGRIQGQKFDIENKDIVIGMIQTIHRETFPNNVFSSFGLTIVDEVHRIASEEFSKALFKCITPFMLGISATVDRNDGLCKLLHYFIGKRIYSEKKKDGMIQMEQITYDAITGEEQVFTTKRRCEDYVFVRGIFYTHPDEEFNLTENDRYGKVKYSTMISKLCSFTPRTIFIANAVVDLYVENPRQQIMLLSHQRGLLTDLYDFIKGGLTRPEICAKITMGYYVGQMKKGDLQESEGKNVIFATYGLVKEGLDLRTLNTLVMISPMTDIIQTVGRILREKRDCPIVVDIVDSHPVFKNQWAKRKKFYKSNDFEVRTITSDNYRGMALNWDTDTTWKRVYNSSCKTTTVKNSDDEVEEDDDDDEDDKEYESGGYSDKNKGKCMVMMDE